MKRLILNILLLNIFGVSLFGASVIKIICDRNGENIYLNGKYKSSCDENEILRLLVEPGKYTIVVKKQDTEARYEYKKSFKIGDEVQKVIEVSVRPVYSEYHYFKNAISQENKSGCDEYLKRYPNGKYKNEIEEFLTYLKAKEDFDAIKLYKKRYPNGKYLKRLEKYFRDNPLIATLKYNNKAVYTLNLIGDRYLYAGGGAERLLMWDIDTKKLLKNFPYPTNTGGGVAITTLDISPDKKYALSNGRGFREWDLFSGKSRVLKTFYGPRAIKYLDNSKALITYAGRLLEVYDIKANRVLYAYEGDKKYNCDLDYFTLSKDKRYAYFGMFENKSYVIKKYDINQNKIVKIYKDAKYLIDGARALKLSPNGKYLISGTFDGSNSMVHSRHDRTIQIWDEKSAKVVKILHQSGAVFAIDIDNNGKFLATGGSGKSIKIWDFKTGTLLKSIYAGFDINDLKFTKNGKKLIVALSNGNINIYYLGYLNLKNILPDKLMKCKKYSNIRDCNEYLLLGGKSKEAKDKIVSKITSIINKNGSHILFRNPTLYIQEKENTDHFRRGNKYSVYRVKAIISEGKKVFVLVNMEFNDTSFTFNSSIYLVQNGKKVKLTKRYPNDYKIGILKGEKGNKNIDIVFEFDGMKLKKGRYKIIENTGNCPGCLNLNNGNIVKVF